MYLSRIQLRPDLPLQKLSNSIPQHAYAEHKIIWQLFTEEKQRNFLFRREQLGHLPMFYILSEHAPQDPQGIWKIDSRPFQPRLSQGQRLAFMLRVNPVITRKHSDDKHDNKRQRDDVIMHEKWLFDTTKQKTDKCPSQAELVQQAGRKWLFKRAEQHGFKLETFNADNYQQHRFYKPKEKHPIQFSSLDYQGILEVTDTQTFTQMLYTGFGRSKSFGCGLMLIRRAY